MQDRNDVMVEVVPADNLQRTDENDPMDLDDGNGVTAEASDEEYDEYEDEESEEEEEEEETVPSNHPSPARVSEATSVVASSFAGTDLDRAACATDLSQQFALLATHYQEIAKIKHAIQSGLVRMSGNSNTLFQPAPQPQPQPNLMTAANATSRDQPPVRRLVQRGGSSNF